MWNSSIAHFPWCDFSNTFWIFKNFTLLSFLLRVSTNPNTSPPNTSHCLSYPSPYSLLSPLNSPSPLAYLSNLSTTLHPFHLSLFHLFPSMQPCVCSLLNLPVPTSTLSCPLPLFLAKLSTLTTLSPFPFPSIHSILLPIQLSLSYFQVLFTSSQSPLPQLPSLLSSLSHLLTFISPFLPVSPSFIDSFQFTLLLPVCCLNPLLHHWFPTSSLFLPISLPHFPLIFITFSTPYQPCIPVKISDHPPFFLPLSHSLYIHMFSPCHPQYVSICKN